MTDLYEDLKARMAPSVGDIGRAAAAIAASGTTMALTPIVFPGKSRGVWCDDTVVETTTLVFACNNDESFHVARNEASIAGARILGERPGTVGYVVHRPTTVPTEPVWAVFEEILTPLDLLTLDDGEKL